METKVTENGASAIIEMTGQIDTNTAKDAKEVFRETADAHDEVILDMAGVSYISSAGIRVLRDLYMIMYQKNGRLKMENANETVISVLEMTGLLDLLQLENDE